MTSELSFDGSNAVQQTQNLGFISDYDSNGFTQNSQCEDVIGLYYYGDAVIEVCPLFAGDFVTPGAPVEGAIFCLILSSHFISYYRKYRLDCSMD